MGRSLEQYLQETERINGYRVDAVLKQAEFETTERVFFTGVNGSEQGPFIKKHIVQPEGSSLGSAYQRIFEAQQRGIRFLGIPRIIECVSIGGTITVITEFVPGKTLDAARPTQPADIAKTFALVCDAAIELHERFDPPIIHRDIKPSNIIVNEESVTLIDFGIARSINDQSAQDTTHLGTRNYAPPEQFGFAQTDERSDVYTLGLVLYFLLSGKDPCSDFKKTLDSDKSIPANLKHVIRIATEFDPKRRYASARQLKEAANIAFGNTPLQREDHQRFSWRNPQPDNRTLLRKAWGFARNVILAAVAMVMVAASYSSAAQPRGSDFISVSPFPVRVVLYLSFIAIPCIVICYLLADKEPLRRRFPLFRRIKGKAEVLYSAAAICISLLFFVLVCAALTAVNTPIA